ncbi:MAG TPA: helix-turn-helix domain-containing protein [Sphingobium sp.]
MDWHKADIKAAIEKRGGSLTQLAQNAGVSKQAISLALHARVSERCDRVISDFLNVPPAKIWPSRYEKNGARIGSGRGSAAS